MNKRLTLFSSSCLHTHTHNFLDFVESIKKSRVLSCCGSKRVLLPFYSNGYNCGVTKHNVGEVKAKKWVGWGGVVLCKNGNNHRFFLFHLFELCVCWEGGGLEARQGKGRVRRRSQTSFCIFVFSSVFFKCIAISLISPFSSRHMGSWVNNWIIKVLTATQ